MRTPKGPDMPRRAVPSFRLLAAAAAALAIGGGMLPAFAGAGLLGATGTGAASPAVRTASTAAAATATVPGHPTAGAGAGAGATGATGVTGGVQRLATDVLPGLSMLAGRPAPAGQVLTVGLGLQLPDLAVAQAFVHDANDPASPDYRHFLTPAQFAARFGVAPATYAHVLDWLRAGGLRVVQTSPVGDWVEATGTVAQLERRFATPIEAFTAKGVPFLANTAAPAVPAGAGVLSVVGLNTLEHFTPTLRSAPPRLATPAAPAPPACLPTSCYYTPQDMWSLYRMPSDNLGQGQRVAVFGEGQSADVVANLRAFERQYKLRQVPVTVHDVGPGPFTDDSGQIEWDLDTQASTGMAPDAYGVTLYFAKDLMDASVETELTRWVDDPFGPLQANASFGECETNPTNPVTGQPTFMDQQYGLGLGDNLEPVAENTLMQAAAEGRTLFTSAGDTGSSCPVLVLPAVGAGNGVANQGVPIQNYPCVSDYAVCVGGTVLYSDGGSTPHRSIEHAWTFSGGGAAPFQREADFQRGDAAVNLPCALSPSGAPASPGAACRGVPDVAAMSGDIATNGYDIYANGAPTVEGGTSLSSPLWVGMWTRIQAAAPPVHWHGRLLYHGLGFAGYPLYRVGENATAYAHDFTDIVLGTNGVYHAAPGWDYVSGWGVPVVAPLMATLDGRTQPVRPELPPPPKPAPASACNALWLNPPHTATDLIAGNPQPQLSLLAGNMATTGSTLRVRLTVQNLTTTVPPGYSGEDWYMTWNYRGTEYFAQANLSLTGTLSYADGTVAHTANGNQYNVVNVNDKGAFRTGPDGVVEIDVPLGHVGGPAAGAVLASPAGVTYTEIGVPSNPAGVSGGSLQQVDSGGPQHDYVVGTTTGTSAGCPHAG